MQLTASHCIAMGCFRDLILLAPVFLYYCAGQHRPNTYSTESLSSTPCEHPGTLYPLAPLSPQADACPSPEMAGLGTHACHYLVG